MVIIMVSAEKRQSNLDSTDEIGFYYRDMLNYVERLHRLLLDMVKNELDREGREDINAVQALLLYNIGAEELNAGDLRKRGFYQGSNVSYNLKKLVETGYIIYERSNIDRRSVRVKLSKDGMQIKEMLNKLYSRQSEKITAVRLIDVPGLEDVCLIMKDFERFWNEDLARE